MKVVSDFGPIKNITLPDGWQKQTRPSRPLNTSSCINFHPFGEKGVSIELFYRGAPLSAGGAKEFQRALYEIEEERDLTGDEIKALQEVFGNAGQNQFTHTSFLLEGKPPFSLLRASRMMLNGKPVLCVAGNFQDKDGVATTEFYGLFMDLQDDARVVYELYLEAKDKLQFTMYIGAFESAIRSIAWS